MTYVIRGGRDPASVLNSFEETAAHVFASLCHLTAGDHRLAEELLVRTFTRFLPPDAHNYESPGGSLDLRSMIIAAHRCTFAHSAGNRAPPTSVPVPSTTRSAPVGTTSMGALTSVERAVIDLQVGERMTGTEISLALRIAQVKVDQAGATALAQLESSMFGRPIDDALTDCEVWFDDGMRSRCRAEIEAEITTAWADGGLALQAEHPDRVAAPSTRKRALRVAGSFAAAVVAVVAIGVWLAPSAKSPDTHFADLAATTTSVASTGVSKKDPSELPDPATTGPTTTSPQLAAVAGAENSSQNRYVLDPVPDGYVGAGARSDSAETPMSNWLEVWATDRATRTEGRWFAIMVDNDPAAAIPLMRDAVRTIVGGLLTLTAEDAGQVTRVIQRRSNGRIVRFESFGLAAADVRELVLATVIATDGSVVYTPRFGAVADGLQVVAAGRTADSGFVTRIGAPLQNRSVYKTVDGTKEIDLVSARQVPNDLEVARLLSPAPLSIDPTDARRLIAISGGGALVGMIPPESDLAATNRAVPTLFAQWHDGATTVTIQAAEPVDRLIQIARSALLASNDAWAAAMRGENLIPYPIRATGGPFQFQTIGTNVTTAGDTWKVGLVDLDGGAVAAAEQQQARPAATTSAPGGVNTSVGLAPNHDAPLIEFASFDATVVVIVFATAPPAGASSLRVTVSGRSPVDTPIVTVSAPAWSGAAFAFSEQGSFTAALVDAEGNLIATVGTTPGG